MGVTYDSNMTGDIKKYLANASDRKWFEVQLEGLISREAHEWKNLSEAKASLIDNYLPDLVKARLEKRSSSFDRDEHAEIETFGRFQKRAKQAAWARWSLIKAEIRSSLLDIGIEVLDEKLDRFKKVSKSKKPLDLKVSVANKWQPLVNRPELPPREMTPTEAEHYVCNYLLFLGASGAKVSQQSRDGGIDVESENFIVQVKHQHAPVGVKVVREMLGSSMATGKQPVIFAKTGYSSDAAVFAYEQGVALFAYTPIFVGLFGQGQKYMFEGMEGIIPLKPDRAMYSWIAKDIRSGLRSQEVMNAARFGK